MDCLSVKIVSSILALAQMVTTECHLLLILITRKILICCSSPTMESIPSYTPIDMFVVIKPNIFFSALTFVIIKFEVNAGHK